jgi:ABC-type sugar transport system ATPase subunit
LNGIVLNQVKKSYSGVPAVRDLSLDIREKEFLTLLGPSGCGKTTTLRMIAGLEDADDGEIIVGDTTYYSRSKGIYVPPENRHLGFIFQSYALWPHMTVRKNISLGLENRKLMKSEVEEIVAGALAKVQLTGYDARYPSELSGGQQQRVAVARMIASERQIFLMDEPLSNLDAMLRTDMRAELKRLHHELNATTVYVTHDQVEALTLSDRIAVMDSGLLRQIGTPEEIYKKPSDLFVASFVGSPRINAVPGEIKKDADEFYFTNGDLNVKLVKPPDHGDSKVVLTIRPENVTVSRKQTVDSHQCRIYSVLPAGSETIIAVRTGETTVTLKVNGFTDLKVDDELWMDFDPSQVNFYDPESENLLS